MILHLEVWNKPSEISYLHTLPKAGVLGKIMVFG